MQTETKTARTPETDAAALLAVIRAAEVTAHAKGLSPSAAAAAVIDAYLAAAVKLG